jgi:toxin ParE1/3/4
MKRYEVLLTQGAEGDLQDLHDYIADHDAPAKAEHVMDKLQQLIESLHTLPERGVVTKELRELGITDYREVYFKPYRVIYRVINNKVFVYLIVDGRRDMPSVLARRLMRV